MPLPPRRLLPLALLWLLSAGALVPDAKPSTAAPLLTESEISQAARRAASDPELGTESRERKLVWNRSADKEPQPTLDPPGALVKFFEWFGNLWEAIAGGARWLLLTVALIAASLLIPYLLRAWTRGRPGKPDVAAQPRPTHVRGLDIRPDQLPDDPAAAALELWNAGQQRAALQLLYRAALSRLVHRWSVPIDDACTEGDCVRLSEPRLPASGLAYLRSLVGAWSRAAYAGEPPGTREFSGLCGGFAAGLDFASAAAGQAAP